MDIDPDAPWAAWPSPEAVTADVKRMRVDVDATVMPSGGERLVIGDEHGVVGYPTFGALRDLSTRAGFPMDFVAKLPLRLQAEVINARIQACDATRMTMARQPFMVAREGRLEPSAEYSTVVNVTPGWRGLLPHAAVAQTAFDILASVYQRSGVSVALARLTDEGMELRLRTTYAKPVTPAVGDVLSLGVSVWHRYGVELGAALYAERLACLNGMTATRSVFEWKSAALGTPQAQLEWLMVGVANALQAFDGLVEKSRAMAAARVHGDAERALVERARAMRLPQRHDEALLQAFRQEPDPSEWGFLNAFTRLATHGGEVTESQRARMQATAGSWVERFDMVSARLPRPIAEAVGASIYEEGAPVA